MKFTQEQEIFISHYVKALREKDAVIFAGAGMSVPQGFFDWKELLRPLAEELILDIDKESDLTSLAQMYVDNKNGRGKLNQILSNAFNKKGIEPSENHKILARLPISTYWTTNYDCLIEKALEEFGKITDVKSQHKHLIVDYPKRDVIIYKMHGDVSLVADTVLTKHDYEDYNQTRELFSNIFKTDFISKSFLFIGFSFTDPNLDYLMSRIRTIYKEDVDADDYYFIKKESDPKAYHRQTLRATSLLKYGLNPILVNDYNEITLILREIERRYMRNVVFISGSASNYGSFGDGGEEFLFKLSRQISKKEYKVLTGFGLGVGSSIINGVLENMGDERSSVIDNYLIMRPFPQSKKSGQDLGEIWRNYREGFIPLAGIAIFVFGNKKHEDEAIVLANGMHEEFKIAVEKGLKVIPIGATGFVAKELWDIVMSNFETYYSNNEHVTKDDFEQIGRDDISDIDLITATINIINKLNNK